MYVCGVSCTAAWAIVTCRERPYIFYKILFGHILDFFTEAVACTLIATVTARERFCERDSMQIPAVDRASEGERHTAHAWVKDKKENVQDVLL